MRPAGLVHGCRKLLRVDELDRYSTGPQPHGCRRRSSQPVVAPLTDAPLSARLPLYFDRTCPYDRLENGNGVIVARVDLPQGTLDLLILRTLALEPQHGWGISERIRQVSRDVLQVQQGSLYPALHRLERRGWILAKWGVSDNNRRAKYYELTLAGQRQLEDEATSWRQLSTAVESILDMA